VSSIACPHNVLRSNANPRGPSSFHKAFFGAAKGILVSVDGMVGWVTTVVSGMNGGVVDD
jgi:hypothetical protein